LRLATYRWGGRVHVGRIDDAGRAVTPLAVAGEVRGCAMTALIDSLAQGGSLPRAAGSTLALSAVTLQAPIPLPRRNLFCSGVNYHAHAAEFAASGMDASAGPGAPDVPAQPVVFSKVPECVIGPGEPIHMPRVSSAIDYEAELAVIIGRPGRGIAMGSAMDHVFGYTILNDVTARDLQRGHRQWLIGKSLDTFGPMGPWIVTADALDTRDLGVRCWVNDELRQDARTRDLIFSIPDLIAAISAGITLLPGDIIATGTPAGVGIGFDPPKYLRRGDRVRIEIEGLGTLENPVH